MYDIIGDIHGHYDLLIRMLDKLGYQNSGESYLHPGGRKVIFTGDFINRGPKIRKTVNLIRKMVESGDALTVLGNHELNAILYETMDKQGKFLQKHLPQFKLPLMKTFDEYRNYPEEFKEVVKWFRTLPVYLDLGNLRVVHGCWSDEHVATIQEFMNGEIRLKKSFLRTYVTNKTLNTALNELIKGVELQLPRDLLIKDNNGVIQRNFRIKWWEDAIGKTFSDLSFGNRFELPAYTIPKEIVPRTYPYPADAPPVFLGHYCLNNKALIFQDNICCIDTCVVRTQKLTAYRWNGESKLNEENIIRM